MSSCFSDIILLKIRIPNGNTVIISSSSVNTIHDIKQELFQKINIPINLQVLTYKGLMLIDEFTIKHYNMSKISTLVLAPFKKQPKLAKAQELFQRFVMLVGKITEADGDNFDVLFNEITNLIQNPILIGASRIDKYMSQVIEDGKHILEMIERPFSRKILNSYAQSQDLQMTRIEQIASSEKLLRMMEEEEEDNVDFQEYLFPQPFFVEKSENIQYAPLPNPWENESLYVCPSSIFPACEDLKQVFAFQLCTLKKMGFTNEDAIVNALSETGGNVQLAAEILHHRPTNV